MLLLYYFILFYVFGLLLWVTKKYDLITISIIYIVCTIFLLRNKLEIVIYLIIFFGVAEVITMIFDRGHSKRNYKNLLGNCIVGTIAIMFGLTTIALATLCAAFCDTLSSEIGRLSKRKPVLITTLKQVESGVDGGVTLLGFAGAVIGAIITLVFFWFFNYDSNSLLIIVVCGLLGTIIDSVIGATFQRKGYLDNNQTNFLATFIVGIIAAVFVYVL
jgi:uncharacterized protein (TIGR00297 family)